MSVRSSSQYFVIILSDLHGMRAVKQLVKNRDILDGLQTWYSGMPFVFVYLFQICASPKLFDLISTQAHAFFSTACFSTDKSKPVPAIYTSWISISFQNQEFLT